jgi:hypothetical protein
MSVTFALGFSHFRGRRADVGGLHMATDRNYDHQKKALQRKRSSIVAGVCSSILESPGIRPRNYSEIRWSTMAGGVAKERRRNEEGMQASPPAVLSLPLSCFRRI